MAPAPPQRCANRILVDMEPAQRPPIASAPISVILIAGDNGLGFEESLRGWAAALGELQRRSEMIVVDPHGSPQVEALVQGVPNARVLHSKQGGLGASLRTGIAAARFPLVVYCHADKQFLP